MGKRILTRRRGAAKPSLISPSHRHKTGGPIRYPLNYQGNGKVTGLRHVTGRTAVVADVLFEDGTKLPMLASEGMSVGQAVIITDKTMIQPGNVTVVSKIPEGTPIYNIEGRPNDGGKYVRTAGNNAEVVSHDKNRTIIRMPSGKFRDFHPACRATVGLVAGGGRGDKPFVKAGKKHHLMKTKAARWPRVRGVAMNPVDHPHGGGNHSYTPGKTSVARGTPPGRKVGKIAPSRTGKR